MGLPRLTPWQALVINILFQGTQNTIAFYGAMLPPSDDFEPVSVDEY